MQILYKKVKNGAEVSIEDGVNNLGMKFFAPTSDFQSEAGLEKIFNAIGDYIDTNYTCLHEKKVNGIKIINGNIK